RVVAPEALISSRDRTLRSRRTPRPSARPPVTHAVHTRRRSIRTQALRRCTRSNLALSLIMEKFLSTAAPGRAARTFHGTEGLFPHGNLQQRSVRPCRPSAGCSRPPWYPSPPPARLRPLQGRRAMTIVASPVSLTRRAARPGSSHRTRRPWTYVSRRPKRPKPERFPGV